MSKTQKILILLAILVTIIIIILILLIYNQRGKIIYQIDEVGEEYHDIYDTTIKRVSSKNDYFTVEGCVGKFYTYYASSYDKETSKYDIFEESELSEEEEKKLNAKVMYNMLDEEYIKANQITENNVLTKLTSMKNSIIDITNMYASEGANSMTAYIVEGCLREKKSGKITDFNIIIKQDQSNRTFSVLPQDYVTKKYSKVKEGETIDLNLPESIEKNSDNAYDYVFVNEEQYVNKIKSKFQEEIMFNRELVYNELNEEYKEAKFSDLNDFISYAKNNLTKFVAMQVNAYQRTEKDDYTQYVIIDKKDNYYIFQETAPMQYDVLLDTYTIDIPEFTQKYTASLPQEKVMLNLNKFMLAINDKDYKYAYGVLADSFKANNFTSLKAFQEYVEENFFDTNVFEYLEFGDEAGAYYTYKVRISGASGGSSKNRVKTFVMRLGDETEFEVAFDV